MKDRMDKLKYIITALSNEPYSMPISITDIEKMSVKRRLDILQRFLEDIDSKIDAKGDSEGERENEIIDMVEFLGYSANSDDEGQHDISNTRSFVDILHWCFSNKKFITERVYLSKYLHLNYPDSCLGDQEFLALFNRLQQSQETFREVHRVWKESNEILDGDMLVKAKKDGDSVVRQSKVVSQKIAKLERTTDNASYKNLKAVAKTLIFSRERRKNIYDNIDDETLKLKQQAAVSSELDDVLERYKNEVAVLRDKPEDFVEHVRKSVRKLHDGPRKQLKREFEEYKERLSKYIDIINDIDNMDLSNVTEIEKRNENLLEAIQERKRVSSSFDKTKIRDSKQLLSERDILQNEEKEYADLKSRNQNTVFSILKGHDKSKESLINQIVDLKGRIHEYTVELNKLQEAENRSTNGQTVDVAKLKNDIAKKKKEIAPVVKEMKSLKTQVDRSSKELQTRLAAAKEGNEVLFSNLLKAGKEKQALEGQNSALNDRIAALESQIVEVEKKKKILVEQKSGNKDHIDDIQRQLNDLEDEIEEQKLTSQNADVNMETNSLRKFYFDILVELMQYKVSSCDRNLRSPNMSEIFK